MSEVVVGATSAADEESVLQHRQIVDHLFRLQHLQNPSLSNLLLPNGPPDHWQRLKPEVNGTSVAEDDPAEVLNKIGSIVMAALLGFQAIPIRLKILLERIFQDLPSFNVELLLSKAGWTMADFARGYLLNEKSDASANPPVWVCASLYSELNLLHVVSMLLPAYAQLAESMRQTALHSLVYTAVLVQQQQAHKPTNLQQPAEHVAKMEESAQSSSFEAAKVEQLDEQQYILKLDQNLEDQQSASIAVPFTKTSNTGGVNEVETTISIVNPLAGQTSAASLFQNTSEMEACNGADRLMTPPFVVGASQVEGVQDQQDHFDGSVDRVAAARKMSRKCLKNGKHRVECPICFKTYCDKGALKIHTSAVHLKETHCCTVEGCDKIFSSRRSRNRHSGNPSMHNLALNSSSRLSCSLLSSPASHSSSSARSASYHLHNPASPQATPEFLAGPPDMLAIFPNLPAIPKRRAQDNADSPCSPILHLPSRKRKRQRPSKLPDTARKTERNCLEPQKLASLSQISALQSLLALGQQPALLTNLPSSLSAASTICTSTTPVAVKTKVEGRGEATLRDILQAVAQKQHQPLLTAS